MKTTHPLCTTLADVWLEKLREAFKWDAVIHWSYITLIQHWARTFYSLPEEVSFDFPLVCYPNRKGGLQGDSGLYSRYFSSVTEEEIVVLFCGNMTVLVLFFLVARKFAHHLLFPQHRTQCVFFRYLFRLRKWEIETLSCIDEASKASFEGNWSKKTISQDITVFYHHTV